MAQPSARGEERKAESWMDDAVAEKRLEERQQTGANLRIKPIKLYRVIEKSRNPHQKYLLMVAI
jgi:hypothetical protein